MRTGALGGVVRWRQLLSAEGAMIFGGLGIAAAGAAIDIWATMAALVSGDPSAHDSVLAYNLPITGLAFIAFGLFMAQSSLFLRKGLRRVYLASLLLIGDGLIHLTLIAPHLAQLHQAAFFGIVAGVEIAAGLTLPESSRRLRDVWIGLSLGLIVLYAVSRVTAVPVLFDLEGVEALGVLSKVLEVLLIFVLLSMRSAEFDGKLRTAATQAAKAGESAANVPR